MATILLRVRTPPRALAHIRVSVPGLISKMSQAGFSQNMLQWFSSFLVRRQQQVLVNGSYSSWETVRSGIPQGTVLGPTLFLIFVNDLPKCLSTDCALFADDTTTYAIGRDTQLICTNLSSDISAASNWAQSWGMLFNAEKSERLSISSNGCPDSNEITMGNTKIPKVTNILESQYKTHWNGLSISITYIQHVHGRSEFYVD